MWRFLCFSLRFLNFPRFFVPGHMLLVFVQETGKTTKHMVGAGSCTRTAMFTRANGRQIRPMGFLDDKLVG